MDLVEKSLYARGAERPKVHAKLLAHKPGGSKFIRATLRAAVAYDGAWAKDDRRINLVRLLTDLHPDPSRWPELAKPEVRAEIHDLITALLHAAVERRCFSGWRHLDEIARFLTRFDLWTPEHASFLIGEISLRTPRASALVEPLITVFGEAPDEVRENLRTEMNVPHPRFLFAALLWFHGPPLSLRQTVAAWLKFEAKGRAHDATPTVRAALRHLADRLVDDLRQNSSTELAELLDGDLDLGLLSENDQTRVRDAIARLRSPSCVPELATP